MATVCDKGRPGWSRADGPVGQFDDTVCTFVSLPGLVVIALVVASVLIRGQWLFGIGATVTFLLTSILVASWYATHPIQAAALAEGCVTEPILPTATLAALCGLMLCRTVKPGAMH